MTLILCLGNRENVVLLSDRRLTLPGGKIVATDSNKAAVLITRDARLAVGYTGFAGTGASVTRLGPPARGDFKTAWWILEALKASGTPETPAAVLIERFVAIAQRDIDALATRIAYRGLLVGFAGYSYTPDETRLFLRTVPNLDSLSNPTDTFRLEETPDGEAMPPAYMEAYGTYQGLSPAGMSQLGALVQELSLLTRSSARPRS